MPAPMRSSGIAATALPLAAASSARPAGETALVSPAVYARLARRAARRDPDDGERADGPGRLGRVCACVTFPPMRPGASLVVFVQPTRPDTEGETIFIPAHLLPSTGPPAVTIQPHTPVVLSTLVLRPSRALLPGHHPRPDAHTVFRLNSPVSLDKHTYLPVLTEPVAQGIAVASTRLLVVPPEPVPAWADADGLDSLDGLDAGSVAGTHVSLADFDPDAFLNAGVGIAQAAPSGPLGVDAPDADEHGSGARRRRPSPAGDERDAAESTASLSTSGSLTPRPNGAARPLSPEPDATAVDDDDAPYLVPTPAADGDDEQVGLGVVDLARAGVFEGDWVVVAAPGGIGRLARAAARDVAEHEAESPGLIALPPILHRALVSDPGAAPPRLAIAPTPFGPRAPTLPVARAVTLARLATAESVDKRFERAWVAGLRRHFARARIARRGDVLAVPVWPDRPLGDDDGGDEAAVPASDVEVAGRPSALVYFRVAALEFEPVVHPEMDFRTGVASKARAGELGCWVDCEGTVELADDAKRGKTRMVVEQVERARVAGRGADRVWHGLPSEPPVVGLTARRLRQLLEVAFKSPWTISVLLQGGRGAGKTCLVRGLADEVGLSVVSVHMPELAAEPPNVVAGTLSAALDKARAAAPAVLLLHHVEALSPAGPDDRGRAAARVLAEIVRDAVPEAGWPVVVIGTSTDDVDKDVRACFKQELAIEAPDEAERGSIIRHVFAGQLLAPGTDLAALGTQTASFLPADLQALAWRAEDLALERACASSYTDWTAGGGGAPVHNGRNGTHELPRELATVKDVIQAGPLVGPADLEAALDEARQGLADRIGAPNIPKVAWEDVGGLESVKRDILDTVQLPLEHPELFAKGLRKRSGILLYGPPGTGKTLLAKAVATSCALNFLSVKGPELLNMYIGESEANVRRVFARARAARPCVVFMDELDACAPKRGAHGDSAGVMDRIVAQLLAELDGAGSGGDVVVMGATNRPDLLDPALLRPGRFDKMLYLGPPDSHATQAAVLSALTRQFALAPALDMGAVAARLPLALTGADLYALCADAMLGALGRVADEVDGEIAALERARDEAERQAATAHRPPRVNGVHGVHGADGVDGARGTVAEPASPPGPGRPEPRHAWPRPLTPAYYLGTMRPDVGVVVGADDFARAAAALRGSVSADEMAHYRRVQDEFRAFSIQAA